MATNTSNNTHVNTSPNGWMPLPASQCIPWVAVFSTECLATVILNIITIIVFVKQSQLQRRSTYLIIHLAIIDLLVGAVSGPLWIERILGVFCELWDINKDVDTWGRRVKLTIRVLPFPSLLNLAVISLERLHATICPFRHRFIKKWVYGVIIAVIWITPVITVVGSEVMQESSSGWRNVDIFQFTYFLFCLFVICVSYICIIIKVRCRPHPRHHGAAGQRDRKLTRTLLLVTLASLLTWLPWVICYSLLIFHTMLLVQLSRQSLFHIDMTLRVLCFANSLINPIIYALRMPELRAGVSQLFRRKPNRQPNPLDLPLQNL